MIEVMAGDVTESIQRSYGGIVGLRCRGRAGRGDDKTKAKKLTHVMCGKCIDAIALSGKNRNKLFLFKTKQGVTYWGSTYTVLLSKHLLPEFLAGRSSHFRIALRRAR